MFAGRISVFGFDRRYEILHYPKTEGRKSGNPPEGGRA
jgi:hypothetical protein